MEIYLIRHTTPAIAKGICYGQSDIDVESSFTEEANQTSCFLPAKIEKVYSSPLKRCKKLAEYLFPDHSIEYADELKEINCGEWELKDWNEIDQEKLQTWMNDFVNICFPGGESFTQLIKRSKSFLKKIEEYPQSTIAIVTHAGVIRSILSLVHCIPPENVFSFDISYGSVTHLHVAHKVSAIIGEN